MKLLLKWLLSAAALLLVAYLYSGVQVQSFTSALIAAFVIGLFNAVLRPVLVVSDKAFNHLGLCVVCPITQGGLQSRFAGFAVTLMGSGSETQGVVMCNQPRTIDMQARQARFIERVPPSLLNEVMARLQAVFED